MHAHNGHAEYRAPRTIRQVLTLAFSIILLLSFARSWGQGSRKLVKKVDPVYLELARKMNMTGTVEDGNHYRSDGSVQEVRTLGGNPVLVVAVENAVRQWKYANGPAETKKTVEFKF